MPELKDCSTGTGIPTLKDHLDDFLMISGFSQETYRSYRQSINGFILWAGDMPLTPQLIALYRTYLINSGKSAHTIALRLSAIRRFLSHLVISGVISTNPAICIRSPKVQKNHLRDALETEEARSLLASINKDNLRDIRDFAIINLMLRTGIRTNEAIMANIGDIVCLNGINKLMIHGKGRCEKDDFVILEAEALNPINEYLSMRDNITDDSPLFSKTNGRRLTVRALRKIITCRLMKAGLKRKRITPHSLRHTAINLAFHGGASLTDVQQMARHEDLTTTLRYFHGLSRIENAAETKIKL